MRHRRGVKYPVTQDWLLAVARKMSELSVSQAELARACDTSEATISRILSVQDGRIRESSFVGPISRHLGIPIPMGQISDPQVQELIEAYSAMDPDDQVHFLAIARRMRKLAQK